MNVRKVSTPITERLLKLLKCFLALVILLLPALNVDAASQEYVVFVPLMVRPPRYTYFINEIDWDFWSDLVCKAKIICTKSLLNPRFSFEITPELFPYMVIVYDEFNNAFVFPLALYPDEDAICAAWVCLYRMPQNMLLITGGTYYPFAAIFTDERRDAQAQYQNTSQMLHAQTVYYGIPVR